MDAADDLKTKSGSEVKTKKAESRFWKRLAVYAAALLVAFLLGLIPMWMSKSDAARQRDAAQANLRLSQLQNRLATAAIYARRGKYEPARLAASDFYFLYGAAYRDNPIEKRAAARTNGIRNADFGATRRGDHPACARRSSGRGASRGSVFVLCAVAESGETGVSIGG
jgi:hypothetical protein